MFKKKRLSTKVYDKPIYRNLAKTNSFNEILIAILFSGYCMFFGSYLNIEGYVSDLNLSFIHAIRHFNKFSSTHENVSTFFVGSILIYTLFYIFHKRVMLLGLTVKKLHENYQNNDIEADLIKTLIEQAKLLGVSHLPALYISDMQAPNAFASGYNIKSSFIVLSEGLVRLLSKPELNAILALQLCHIKLKNIKLTLAISLASNNPIIIYDSLFYKFLYKSGDRYEKSFILSKFTFVLRLIRFLVPLFTILYRYILTGMRVNTTNKLVIELLADKENLKSALRKIKNFHEDNKEFVGKVYQNITYDKIRREMYVLDPAPYNNVQTIATPFVVQPTIDEQLDNIEHLEKKDSQIIWS